MCNLADINPLYADVFDKYTHRHIPYPLLIVGPEVCDVVITGSPAMVTERLSWSEQAAQWRRQAMCIHLPLFGVCYGHQRLAYALGGEVGYHPQGMEAGTLDVELLPAGAVTLVFLTTIPYFALTLHENGSGKGIPGSFVLEYQDDGLLQIVQLLLNRC